MLPPEPPGEETEEPEEPEEPKRPEEPVSERRPLGRRYRLEPGGRIPEGRGEVLHAYDEELGRRVVLKRTDPGEARAYAKFNHPHVITVYELITAASGPRAGTWLVMEHAPNGSLQKTKMPPRQAARVGAQIADALAALHAKGLVHCDVKPANIVIAANHAAKLTDFDAAHRLGGDETVTPARPISYTPDYAAPEVVAGTPQPASDVFSLAATLHTLVTGRPPRPWTRERDLGDEHIQRWRVRRGVVELDPNADLGPLRPILAQMLALDADDRPDAAQAWALLRDVADPDVPADPLPPHGHGPRHRWLRVAAGAGALGLAATALIVWLSQDTDHTDDTGTPPAVSLIGEERTADPCVLLDSVMLGHEFGHETDIDRAYGNFDRCDAIVDPDGETPVDISIDFDSDPVGEEGQRPVRSVGDIGILEMEEETDSCERGLRLPEETDDTGIRVIAEYEGDEGDGEGSMPLCRMADESADSAAATLMDARDHGQQIPRRSFPDNSLAHLDACDLLDERTLTGAIPAVDVDDPVDIGFGGWDCEWYSDPEGLGAGLRFDQSYKLDGDDGRATRIDGRDAFVTEGHEGEDSCTVRVAHRSFDGGGTTEKTELLHVFAYGERPTERLCTIATDLATSATARLPSP